MTSVFIHASAPDCDLLLFDLISLDREVLLKLAHLFHGLHLHHDDVLVLLLSPFSQSCLQSVLVVDSGQLFRSLFFQKFLVVMPTKLIDPDERSH